MLGLYWVTFKLEATERKNPPSGRLSFMGVMRILSSEGRVGIQAEKEQTRTSLSLLQLPTAT